MNERWAPIPNYEGLYEVSDQGRVKSLPKRHRARGGKYITRRERILSPATRSTTGHLAVSLRRNGKNTEHFVHALVLKAFISPRPDGMYACHNDGDARNNTLGNLRWDTPSANGHDATRHGRRKPATTADQSPIEDEQWLPIINRLGYEVSDYGRVRNSRTNRILQATTTHRGHQYILGSYAHIYALEAFVCQRPDGMLACHIDGDASNNRLGNLRWDTPGNNNRDAVKHGTHHYSKRELCPKGHPMDGVHKNGARFCETCRKAHAREMKRKKREALKTCPQGHPFDGVRYKADGSVRQRYCTICVGEQLATGRKSRVETKTHCPHGHPLDGVYYNADGNVRQRYCKTCHRARKPRKTLCPNGHEHDMVRRYADGSERPWCSKCLGEWSAVVYERQRAKTHCPHGHLLDAVTTDRNGRSQRYCKTCHREAARRASAKRKAVSGGQAC